MIRGCDVSSVQGIVPFASMPPDIRFCIAKCQQGNDGKDPMFEKNWRTGADHGLVMGGYHFAYPLPHLDPAKQAEGFFAGAGGHGAGRGELPPFIDAEWPEPSKKNPDGTISYPWKKWGCSAQQMSDWMNACCARMTELFGTKPVIYTYPWWWAAVSQGVDVSWAAEYPLWIASYPGGGWPAEGAKPAIPKPWTDWLFWQFDGDGGLRLPNGVDADFDLFNGDENALRRLTGDVDDVPILSEDETRIIHPQIDFAAIARERDEK